MIGYGVQVGVSAITFPIYTRVMSPSQYGLFNVYSSWRDILQVFVTLNIFRELFSKGLSKHSDDENSYMASSILLVLFITFVFLFIYRLLYPTINGVMQLSGLVYRSMMLELSFSAILLLWISRYRYDLCYKKATLVIIIHSISNAVLNILAILFFNQNSASARMVATAVSPLLISLFLCVQFVMTNDLRINFSYWKELVPTSLFLIPHYLSSVLLIQSDRILIQRICGDELTAIYSVAYAVIAIITVFNLTLNRMYVPVLYRGLKNDDLSAALAIQGRILIGVNLVTMLTIFFSKEIVMIMAPESYQDVVWSIIPLAISSFIFFLIELFVDVEIYISGYRCSTISSITASIINIMLNILLIPRFGYIVAGYTTLISAGLSLLIHLSFSLRRKNIVKVTRTLSIFKIGVMILGLFLSSILFCLLYGFLWIRATILLLTLSVLFTKNHTLIMNLVKNRNRNGKE